MKWKLAEGVMTYKDDDTGNEYVINPNTGKIFEINETAKVILEGIAGEKTQNEIIEMVTSIGPEIDKKIVINDLRAFIEILQINNIVLST